MEADSFPFPSSSPSANSGSESSYSTLQQQHNFNGVDTIGSLDNLFFDNFFIRGLADPLEPVSI
ncbi:hypothetical protein OROGR_023186 [Orobanche gracilis]